MDGPLIEFLLRCLGPKFGSGTIFKDTPKNIDPDDGMFSANQFIDGPMTFLARKEKMKMNVPKYEENAAKFLLKNKFL